MANSRLLYAKQMGRQKKKWNMYSASAKSKQRKGGPATPTSFRPQLLAEAGEVIKARDENISLPRP